MFLEIVTPEETLYSGEVESVSVPGMEGDFQMLDNHAPIVSLLTNGTVKMYGNITLAPSVASKFVKANGTTDFKIKGGVLEMKDNKAIILAD
jgi:F-type H+-transporting ATPase subunit epsilon